MQILKPASFNYLQKRCNYNYVKVMKCKESNIECVYLTNQKDYVYDRYGNIIRMKRKYGKFKREVQRFDYEPKC